ncbi:MAG: hypothetical protein Q7S20_02820 [Gemmatimonadaceae bacterium]|nr:hypothetical protein [Gemmatimonadaceae bacterium]
MAAELASITKQTGHGPLSSDYSAAMEGLISSKATSLLAVSIAERVTRKGIGVAAEIINPCLPRSLRITAGLIEPQALSDLREKLAEAPVQDFIGIDLRRALPESVSALASLGQTSHGPLLLLLDKADMVPTPALIPVLELLDQSNEYVVLVALRPGHGGYTMSRQDDVTGGDHYAIAHLGTNPRSTEWRAFVASAVEAQLGAAYHSIPSEVRDEVITLSRDSVRNALEIFVRYLSVSHDEAKEQLVAALDDYRENTLHAAQSTLQRFHPSFRGMIRQLREEALVRPGRIDGPVYLRVNSQAPGDLFGTPSAFNSFVEMALRTGAIAMPEGARWMPGVTPSLIEIPPILTWEKGDPPWSSLQPAPIVLVHTEARALSAGGGAVKPPHIFVAYRFRINESVQFRRELASAMEHHRTLSRVVLEDGRVPHGDPWAQSVRDRIRRSKLVVGDVTGVTCEVMFELGFAYGLGKSRIPVVADHAALKTMPRWLTATQTATFGSADEMQALLNSIQVQLADPRQHKPKQPVPGLAVWLRSLDWNKHALEQSITAAGREGLSIECFDTSTSEERLIERAAQATLVVASFDGTLNDSIAHFVCGAVVAMPRAMQLQRQLILIEEHGAQPGTWVADSLRRCTDIATLMGLEDVPAAIRQFGQRYRKWSTSKGNEE